MTFRSLVKAIIPRGIFAKIEPWGHLAEAVLFNVINGFPARGLKIIGVTGTDGKTTTCFSIHKVLSQAGYKVGLMTTVSYGLGEDLKPQQRHMTTMPAPVLLKQIKQLKKAGAQWLVLETTSHALAQHRVWGIPYSIAVLTNISHEHLDYHGSFDRYLAAKKKLFSQTAANKKGLRTGVINADDASAGLFKTITPVTLTYGIKTGDLKARDIKLTASGSDYNAEISDTKYAIACHLPGRFNIYNSLAAVAVGRIVGLSPKQIERGIATLAIVPGRMESIDEGQDFKAYVDYAVTPSALESVLKTLKDITAGRLILVFGATGDRDKSKRPMMGEIAAKNADAIFLTDDETYTEDPAAIRQAVRQGIEAAGGAKKTTEIADRRQAIKAAMKAASKDDLVLITGIGHQSTRNMGGREEAWDEVSIVRELLK
ncbi:UDP-N-acetylmuramoyl-L-alanyl-D-glutamate--2,6-diaminopimelate ligase [Candidatus Saccharibacteria bacterium]|nr:UDP-N-acetylmuramoyl-L-alanyl-D-glutamate--2,6-diaminopimelate ligase [Candidatus Saccharibacteria bacterium]